MTSKQKKFIAEYMADLNGTQAAIRAGYSPKVARQQASENLTKPDIAKAIADLKAQQLHATGLSATRVLEEMRRLAFVDMRSFWTEDGQVKRMQDLTEEQGACLASFEAMIKNAQAGDGKQDTIHKFRLWDKVRSLEMLAKHFGILVERMEHQGNVEFTWRK